VEITTFFENISVQFAELNIVQPLLELEMLDDCAVISGLYCIRSLHEGEEFSDTFEIHTIIYPDFPETLPIIKETGGKVRRLGFEHIYPDRVLCPEVDTRMKMDLDQSRSIIDYFEKFITPYFFSYLYYCKYRKFPLGERAHGSEGILGLYCEIFDVKETSVAKTLLQYVCGSAIKGHHTCPCMSGKRYRDCHRSKVAELTNSKFINLFQTDYSNIEGR